RLARGPLSIAEAISILRDVARALAYAHERGIVHRDIKPDNVLLSRGAAMVTDFGIAKAIAACSTGPTGATLTQLGTALGTPAYMAPEQAAGDPNTDHRADIYAFGCMAYELLTGRPPFEARTPQRLLAAHMGETPKPVTALRPGTPPELARLIAQCLVKEPDARPQSADEMLATLDTISTGESTRQTALPGILIGGRAQTWRALGFYAVAFAIVAVVAKAAIVGIGLPDWVFPGSLIVMALGLPVILFTGYAQFVARRAATTSPTFTPGGTPSPATNGTMAGLALKASPHLSWRRTTLGGAYAVGGFVLLVGAFMLLRALGIGPAGSLLARGRFTAREPVIIADFGVERTDTALGAVASDAVRAALSQSSVIALVPPPQIAAELRRMARPSTTRLDLATAREMAQRRGVKAVVDGHVTGVGTGYIVTLRLVSADSGVELASFRESGDGPRGLIDAADQLARKLRGKIGESLRSVQASPPLAQATTPSLEALRLFSEAMRANGIEENPQAAIQYARQAVAVDSNFASAWRLLSAVIGNAGGSRAEADSAIARAYRLRDRLPERERLLTEANYFATGAHADRSRALAAYLALVERGESVVAPTNAGELLRSERAYARAESLDMILYRPDSGTGIAAGNTIELELDQGHVDSAAKMLARWRSRAPSAHGVALHEVFVRYSSGDMPGAARFVDSLQRSTDPVFRLYGLEGGAAIALLHGRLSDADRSLREMATLVPASEAGRLQTSLLHATVDAWFRGPSPNAVKEIDSALAAVPLQRLPQADRPYFQTATAYALAGAPAKADAIIAAYRREVTDTSTLRLEAPGLEGALGALALVRGDAKTALDQFRRSDVWYDGLPSAECAPCNHFPMARAFDAAGERDSAIAEYETYIALPFWSKLLGGDNAQIAFGDALVLAGVHKRLGELYEAAGNRQQAAAHYAAFIALWKNADPELQPQVDEARRRLARLGDSEAKASQ
ncbi:MAG: protein kinase domain-containing protein, partial [Gemmatimonadaceae bacterium]